eukprot:TRINITY_DN23457_c0_g1_i1.p1 TRINITY_DN23457_c0_g1~~TRINITY_DN23457_c0_g1_i1.p1  ORF type:complete len:103 (+),score=3.52 TRINITY_DN23457_c0_g1_i1:3-311(+)
MLQLSGLGCAGAPGVRTPPLRSPLGGRARLYPLLRHASSPPRASPSGRQRLHSHSLIHHPLLRSPDVIHFDSTDNLNVSFFNQCPSAVLRGAAQPGADIRYV